MATPAHRATETKAVGRRAAPLDALKLLKADHDEVAALLDKYEGLGERTKAPTKHKLALDICGKLTVHATIEEEIFYPAVKEAVDEAEDLLAEAEVEHGSLKDLIAKIERQDGEGAEFDALVTVLGEYVRHHVKEEQNELFPKVRKSDLDLAKLGAALAERKQQLMRDEA
ncbi:MAG: hemerythrin domain-containing protein [Alphaproteobacteria bacterium]|nr:hemerythrin domain-containing protein [Alphaproteobacteria bacterium]